MGANRAKRRLFFAAITILILFRTLPYVLFGSNLLDSDQAVFALMAKHLAEGHSFPVFMYGQKFLLAQSSWFAAPLFKIFGTSTAMFALPLLLMNLMAGWLLFSLLESESWLGPVEAFACCLWFFLPSMNASRSLMNGAEGSIEPFLYLLAIWVLRRKPFSGGLIAGIGIAGRPFVLYGIAALVLLELWTKKSWKAACKVAGPWLAGSAITYAGIQAAARFSTNYFGAGTPFYAKSVRHMLEDVRGYFAEILPQTLGLQTHRFSFPPVPPRIQSHWNGPGLVLALIGAILLFFLIRWLAKDAKGWIELCANDPASHFPIYLLLIGLQSFAAYVVLSPPSDDIRYTLLLLLGIIGIYALHRHVCRDGRLRKLSTLLLLGCLAQNAVASARAWIDLSRLDRKHPSQTLIAYLKQRGIHAALGRSYWCAHNLTFISDETVVVDTGPGSRFPANTRILLETPPRNRAVISFDPCPRGVAVESWYVCPTPQ